MSSQGKVLLISFLFMPPSKDTVPRTHAHPKFGEVESETDVISTLPLVS